MTKLNAFEILIIWIQVFFFGEGSKPSNHLIKKHAEAFLALRLHARATGWLLRDYIAAMVAYTEANFPKQPVPTSRDWLTLLTKCFRLHLDTRPAERSPIRENQQITRPDLVVGDWLVTVLMKNPDHWITGVLKAHARVYLRYCKACSSNGKLISLPPGMISWETTNKANASGTDDVDFLEWIVRLSRALEEETAKLKGLHYRKVRRP